MAFVSSFVTAFNGQANRFQSETTPLRRNVCCPKRPGSRKGMVSATMSSAEVNVSDVAGWPDHTLNVNFCLMKESEGRMFSEIAVSGCEILQGVGDKTKALMEAFGVKTVTDLANYKYYKIAKAIAVLAPLEEKDGRKKSSVMNADLAVDVAFEKKSLTEILASPVTCLQGLPERVSSLLTDMHVLTVADLANFKYCQRAEAIVTMASFENKKSFEERKAERLAKKL